MTTSTIATQFSFIMSNLHLFTSKTTWADKLSALGTVKGFEGKGVIFTPAKKVVKTNKLRKVSKARRNKVAAKATRLVTVLMVCDTRMPLTGGQKVALLNKNKAQASLKAKVSTLATKLGMDAKEGSRMALQNILQIEEGGYTFSLRKAAKEVVEATRVCVEAVKAAKLA